MIDKAWGRHLILDVADCNVNISSKDAISTFVKELVVAIDMKAYGDPIVVHFAKHSYDAAGYSLVQLIETSAITGHFSDNNRDAYLDIFSCKDFKLESVIKIVKKTLFSKRYSHSFYRPRRQFADSFAI